MTYKRKLIEVALPLEAINRASAREKSLRHAHPSSLHLWWSRKPLAAARAAVFASVVHDPSSRRDLFPDEATQHRECDRRLTILASLVEWSSRSVSENARTLKFETHEFED